MIAAGFAFAVGLVLGVLHFASLGRLVERLPHSPRPGLLLLAGTVIRFVLLGVSLTLLTLHLGGAVAAAVAGIVVARTFTVRRSALASEAEAA